MKKKTVWKCPNTVTPTLDVQLRKFPIKDNNWKMFHEYVKMCSKVTNKGGTIIMVDPNGIPQRFTNV